MSRPALPRDWDAAPYDRVSEPQVEWGREVLERLPLRGDETVLDAGCGTGRVTRLLQERLPRGRIVAVDASPSMVDRARDALRPGTRLVVADLAELDLDEQVDAVFSSAVFHWIPDHAALFASLHRVMRPGARLVAQCGGAGNLRGFHELLRDVCSEQPFAQHFDGWPGPWNFASAEQTGALLQAAGFGDVECWLERRVVEPKSGDYLRTVCLGHHLERLPAALGDELVARVAERMPSPRTLDYVRLNIAARRRD